MESDKEEGDANGYTLQDRKTAGQNHFAAGTGTNLQIHPVCVYT